MATVVPLSALLLLWGSAAALALAVVLRRPPPPLPPVSLPGSLAPLPGEGLVRVDGDVAELVRDLARTRRVVLAGTAPTAGIEAGRVFVLGPGRVAVEDLLATLTALQGTGAPVVAVVAVDLECAGGLTGEAALARLAQVLPDGGVVYVVAEPGAHQ